MTTNDVITFAARRLAKARGITVAAAAEVVAANPETVAQLRLELAAMTSEQLAALEEIDSPSAMPPVAAAPAQ
jgi:hypothetical protein